MKVPTGAVLSKYLRALAVDIETTNADGDLITKAEALALLVWKSALGWKELDPKTDAEIVHTPDWRAIELLYNRIEGKIPIAVVEEQGKNLIEKVSEMGRARINSLAKAAAEEAGDDDAD